MQKLTEEDLRMLLRLRTAVDVDDLTGFFNRQRSYYAHLCLTATKEEVPKLQGAGLFLEELATCLKDAPRLLAQLEQANRGKT